MHVGQQQLVDQGVRGRRDTHLVRLAHRPDLATDKHHVFARADGASLQELHLGLFHHRVARQDAGRDAVRLHQGDGGLHHAGFLLRLFLTPIHIPSGYNLYGRAVDPGDAPGNGGVDVGPQGISRDLSYQIAHRHLGPHGHYWLGRRADVLPQ